MTVPVDFANMYLSKLTTNSSSFVTIRPLAAIHRITCDVLVSIDTIQFINRTKKTIICVGLIHLNNNSLNGPASSRPVIYQQFELKSRGNISDVLNYMMWL